MTSILRQARRRSLPVTSISCILQKKEREKRKEKRDKLGCFEHLTQIIGAGFDPTSKPAMQVVKNYTKGGLLIMSKDDEHWIKSCLKKELTAVQKFQEVIAYLFEFG